MKKTGLLLMVVAQLLWSCGLNTTDSEVVADKYDRKAMLVNWVDNNIMPSFQHYKSKLENLKRASDDFIATPDRTQLEEVRQKWLEAYKTYQYISMFSIGKADEIQFSKYSNTYPTATGQIAVKIDSGNFDLNGISFDVVQGFPALDYMLFGLGENENAILERYTTNTNTNKYKGYLSALVNRLTLLFNTVYDDWQSGYKAIFIQRSDNTASGSVNRMINAYIHFYEKDIRTAKIGYPAGKFSTETYPDKVEAYYSKKYSKELLLESIIAAQNFFEGKHFNGNESGSSLKSYLDYLTIKGKSEESGILLSKLICNQFYKSLCIANLLLPDLSQQIITDNTKMTATFNVLQRNVAYMKSDMTSAMSIAIDYADTDGD
jgi:hypothetical protein